MYWNLFGEEFLVLNISYIRREEWMGLIWNGDLTGKGRDFLSCVIFMGRETMGRHI